MNYEALQLYLRELLQYCKLSDVLSVFLSFVEVQAYLKEADDADLQRLQELAQTLELAVEQAQKIGQ
ncbi:hypothetical protein AVDCRST_MAG92-2546 [uncultured Coleofasciculus sp.]|jgi:hypothetical protein|uniref:Uncharacterized protein n=1 Tax=uncultured Coleofasciculus sp. TaxID=1267456 RepID=A0A6J4IZ35_9CYAN|nr:hypothetical protein AVDCRST_MAG92-2546 [uncultured Coleofasciculus sp.]